jgi:hypothetical protein
VNCSGILYKTMDFDELDEVATNIMVNDGIELNEDNNSINLDEFKCDPNSTKFSGNAKRWFLTYPQCDLSQMKVKELLDSSLGDKNSIKRYIICKELHQDGNPHIHCCIELVKRMRFKPRLFDLVVPDKTYSGHYEIVLSWKSCVFYCTKDNNFITNMNLFNDKPPKKRSYSKINNLILKNDLHQLVYDGSISIGQFINYSRIKLMFLSTDPTKDRILKRRCFWIYGDAGIGKSYVVRSAFPDVYIKPVGKWWDNYKMQKEVLIEDFDRNTCTLQELKLWADQYGDINTEIKGGMCCPYYDVLIVTSNYSIDYCFPWKDDSSANEAITRRFKLIKYENRSQYDDIIKELKGINDSNEDSKEIKSNDYNADVDPQSPVIPQS